MAVTTEAKKHQTKKLALLFREELGFDISKRFEFQCITRRICEKHGRLLPRLALEADVRLNDERFYKASDLIGQPLPVI